jgi:hypothetical protein
MELASKAVPAEFGPVTKQNKPRTAEAASFLFLGKKQSQLIKLDCPNQ